MATSRNKGSLCHTKNSPLPVPTPPCPLCEHISRPTCVLLFSQQTSWERQVEPPPSPEATLDADAGVFLPCAPDQHGHEHRSQPGPSRPPLSYFLYFLPNETISKDEFSRKPSIRWESELSVDLQSNVALGSARTGRAFRGGPRGDPPGTPAPVVRKSPHCRRRGLVGLRRGVRAPPGPPLLSRPLRGSVGNPCVARKAQRLGVVGSPSTFGLVFLRPG